VASPRAPAGARTVPQQALLAQPQQPASAVDSAGQWAAPPPGFYSPLAGLSLASTFSIMTLNQPQNSTFSFHLYKCHRKPMTRAELNKQKLRTREGSTLIFQRISGSLVLFIPVQVYVQSIQL